METVIKLLNTEGVQYAIILAIAFVARKVFEKEPKAKMYYDKYKGMMVKAVKFAEKEIPNNAKNKHVKRLDKALEYALDLIEMAESKDMKSKLNPAKLTSDISLVHHEIEADKAKAE
jgi:hypothetical protein